MMLRKLLFIIIIFSCVTTVNAQQKIILERFRCASLTGPVMNYLKDENIRRSIASQLNGLLVQSGFPGLTDTISLGNLEYNLAATKPEEILFADKDPLKLHLYIDLFEVSPASFFKVAGNISSDTTIQERTKTVFILKAGVYRSDRSVVKNEEISVVVSEAISPGMGIPFKTSLGQLAVTPKGFVELFKATGKLLFDPKNDLDMVEMKVMPAFIGDNFIVAKAINLPRNYVTTQKNISTYTYAGKKEMIRQGDALYEEILLKGKKARKYPDDITTAIKKTLHYGNSDFVFLRQESRDVIRDKNYLVKMAVQIDPENWWPQPLTFTNFLAGDFHYLLQDNDTLAKFSIEKSVTEAGKKIYLDKVSNGLDTVSFFQLKEGMSEMYVMYDYIVNGKMGTQKFSIKCSGARNEVKEFYVEQQLVCIAMGKFNPQKFVVFDASLSPELLNRLFLIGFNRFFE